MNVLSIENLEKTVDYKPLFSSVTLGLEEGERVGIVGRNGEGKSTFLNVVMGHIHPDEGKVSKAGSVEMGMLEQTIHFSPSATILDFLYEAESGKTAILNGYNQALVDGDEKKAQALLSQIEKQDLWSLETRYKSYLTKFGIEHGVDSQMQTLSGGERKKVALARLFALDPGIMLLDEPTNHLDIKTIEMLEDELRSGGKAVIIVTHDRYILNSVCTTIWELDGGHFYRHPGSYEAYLERRAERIDMLQKHQDRLASILRRELVWLARGPQARTGKDKNRKERIENMLSQVRNVQDVPQTSFSSLERRLGKTILEIKDVSKSYDGKTLFSGFSYSFKKGDRIGIVGDNGTGKSTLLDIITGVSDPDRGSINRGVNTYISYFDQLTRGLKEGKTALEFINEISSRILFCGGEISAERFLELFGFSREKMRTEISVYSGGEKRRLYLISKLAANPNFLVLDEPTNDLDIRTMENLEEYISSFTGCTLIVSHDRAFLNCTCTSLFVIEDGRILNVPTTYTEWKDSRSEVVAEKEKKAQPVRPKRESKGLSFKEQKEFESLEDEIPVLKRKRTGLKPPSPQSGRRRTAPLKSALRGTAPWSRRLMKRRSAISSLPKRRKKTAGHPAAFHSLTL